MQADGTIQYPLVGKLAVAGKTPTQARDVLAGALTKFVRHPIVTLAVTQPGQITVTVLGNVKSPGHFTLRSGAHLTDAIAAASGVSFMNGGYPPARVSQPDGTIATASLQKLLRDGDATPEPRRSATTRSCTSPAPRRFACRSSAPSRAPETSR